MAIVGVHINSQTLQFLSQLCGTMEHGHLHQLEKTNNSLRLTSSHSQNLVCCLFQSFMKQYPKQYEHTTKCSALNSLHGCQMSSLCATSWSVLAYAICKICLGLHKKSGTQKKLPGTKEAAWPKRSGRDWGQESP